MRRFKRAVLNTFVICLAALLAGCSFFAPSQPYDAAVNAKVRVMLESAEGLLILSDFYADAEPGGTVTFSVAAEEGYEIGSVKGGVYDSAAGTITVKDVRYPTTVSVAMIKAGEKTDGPRETPEDKTPDVTEEPSETPDSGTPGPSEDPEASETPEPEITDTPTPEPTPTPLAITLKEPALNEKLYPTFPQETEKPTETLSPSPSGTAPASQTPGAPSESPSPTPVPDPRLETDFKIVYHANGGTITTVDSPAAYTYFSKKNYNLPNALPDTGYFKREGCLLAGYTTNADGTGDFYAPGWNIMTDGTEEINLYCLWKTVEPESLFTCEFTDTYAVIKAYRGNAVSVAIPEKIKGRKVLKIETGAFSGKRMNSVFIPRYVEHISYGAFVDCESLTTVHLPDSVVYMDNGSFLRCGNFKNLYVVAVRNPAYAGTVMGTGSTKFERMESVASPKVIIISGSGCLYGIDTPLFESRLPGYGVVNMGLIVNMSAVFMAEVAANYTKKGDYVVFSPEMNGNQWGLASFSTTMWQGVEAAYETLSKIDIRNYSQIFSSFASFNSTRRGLAEGRYTEASYEINKYGDLSYYIQATKDSYAERQSYYRSNGGTLGLEYAVSLLKDHRSRFNAAMDRVNATGARCLFDFCIIDRLCLTEDATIPYGAMQKYYEDAVDTYLHCDRISGQEEYLFEARLMWNSEWHVTGEGRVKRTKMMAADVQRYIDEHPETLPDPTEEPTEEPTVEPTVEPTLEPTVEPTEVPTVTPTETPTEKPTEIPTETPTEVPTEIPTEIPTEEPTVVPTEIPTEEPSENPTEEPSETPDETGNPSDGGNGDPEGGAGG